MAKDYAFPAGDSLYDKGMTLRDYFWIQILAAAIANPATTNPWGDEDENFLLKASLNMANNMIEAKKKENEMKKKENKND